MKICGPSPDDLDLEKDEERKPLLLKKGALPYTCENVKGAANTQNSVETKAEVPVKTLLEAILRTGFVFTSVLGSRMYMDDLGSFG